MRAFEEEFLQGNEDGNEDERRYDRLGLEGEVQSLILSQRGGSE